MPFRQLVETVVQQIEGAFALAFKSRKFPGQLVATRRGSPLLVGIKSNSRLESNQFPVSFSKARRIASSQATHIRANSVDESFVGTPNILDLSTCIRSAHCVDGPTNIIGFDSENWQVEYFVASDASAIIEHTKQGLYLEDGDVAFVEDGALTIHRIKRKSDNMEQKRDVQLINMELEQIMLGNHRSFMQKEIFEQPDSVVNAMCGRLLPSDQVVLGGIKEYLADIKRCRRLIMVACGTSYNSAIACRQVRK